MRTGRITISVAEDAAEAAASELSDEGLPFEQRDQSTIDRPPPGEVELSVYAPPDAAAELRGHLLGRLAGAGIAARAAIEECDGDAWRDAWKAYFRPRPVGPFVLVPSWERYEARPGETVMLLDPGRAFGTGGHASTRLCLRALADVPAHASAFLDVGCGSGVLAIAAALRWPDARVIAVDVDPEAVEVTVENAARNRARVAASSMPLVDVPGRFDVVLANLTSETLIALAAPLAARVAPGGRLIASGVLSVEAARTVAALSGAGLRAPEGAPLVEDEWSCLVLGGGS